MTRDEGGRPAVGGASTLIRVRAREDGSFTLQLFAPNLRLTWRLDREALAHFRGNLGGDGVYRSGNRTWLVERYSDCVAVHWYGTPWTSLFLTPGDAEWLAAALSGKVKDTRRDDYGAFVEKTVELLDVESVGGEVADWHRG
jgi:hypothetical protein